jgi:general secretion pathway protein D
MYLPRSLLAAALGLALVAGLAPGRALAQPGGPPGLNADTADDAQLYSCAKAKGMVSVSFRPEIELRDLLTWVMGFTCKNFIYEQSVMQRSKKLTIIAPNRMTAQQAYLLFLSGLQTMGLTVVEKGQVLQIVEAGQARNQSLPIRRGTPAAADQMVRMLLRPSNVQAQDLHDALQAVKSPEGDIRVIAKAGIVLVTDYATHVRDMATLTREIDQPAEGAGVYTIKVIYADAKQIADVVGTVLGTSGGAAAAAPPPPPGRGGAAVASAASGREIDAAVPSKILADERTNSLILVSNEAAYLRVRALVKRLDVPLETEGAGSMHVHGLENAKAEELAQTLNNALQGITAPASGTGPQAGRGAPQRRGAEPAPAIQNIIGPEGAAFEGNVKITFDGPTNSLVIISTGRDYLALKQVIQKLDAPRRQVFIEAVILELNTSNDLNLGTSFHGAAPTDSGGFAVGGLQHGNLSSLNLASLATLTGLLGGLFGELIPESQEFFNLGQSIPSYGVLFQALARNRNANVLSSPHILTTDNITAEISVGQNIPYIGGITIGATGALSGLGQASVQRQEVALTMKITPHVNQSDMVRLDIEQEIQDVGERDPQLGPTWTKRKIKTTVVVRDQQSVVIGGLMSDRVSYSESKIPLLGDIPILGYLFKYTERTKAKTNLLVLLTPYIVEDQLDIDRIVERKVRERSEFLRSFSHLETAKYLPQIDYRKKRGLVEEINTTLELVERDLELLRAFESTGVQIPDGPVRYEEEAVAPPAGDPEVELQIDADARGADEPAPPPPAPPKNAPAGKKAR